MIWNLIEKYVDWIGYWAERLFFGRIPNPQVEIDACLAHVERLSKLAEAAALKERIEDEAAWTRALGDLESKLAQPEPSPRPPFGADT